MKINSVSMFSLSILIGGSLLFMGLASALMISKIFLLNYFKFGISAEKLKFSLEVGIANKN